MFNFLGTDNKPQFDIVGTSIISCAYSCRIRDDLKLLISLGFDVERIVKQITDYYLTEIKGLLTDYEYRYYYPLTFISLAYYLAKSGYYHKDTFETAIKFIDEESTLFVWQDAVKYEKSGHTPISDILLNTFGDSANDIAELVLGEPLPSGTSLEKSNVPEIITQILFLDDTAEKKLKKRRSELLKVKNLLLTDKFSPKKYIASSVIFGVNNHKFTTPFCEGDLVSYKIKNGKNKGKYVLLVVDYIRELRNILCDNEHYVEKLEYFALIDGVFDEIPTKIPNKYVSTGEITDFDENPISLNHFCCAENPIEFAKFEFEKVGKIERPKLQKTIFMKVFFSPKENDLADIIQPTDIDDKLNIIFK